MKVCSKDLLKEIDYYKWLESEKEGSDIGFERATLEWLSNHFEGWLFKKPFKSSSVGRPCFSKTRVFF